MTKIEIYAGLAILATSRKRWAEAVAGFNSEADAVTARLLNEAAANYMSADEIAKASGLTVRKVRSLMRRNNLNPTKGRTLLARQAAENLATNSALLGVDPNDLIATSPLAYLPMGETLRSALVPETVHEIGDEPDEDCACEPDGDLHDLGCGVHDALFENRPLTAEESYDAAKRRIANALVLGVQVDEIRLTPAQVNDIAAWLASEGIK